MPAMIAIVSNDRPFSDALFRLFTSDSTFTAIRLNGHAVRLALRSSAPYLGVIDARMNGALSLCGEISTNHAPGIVCARVADHADGAVDALAAGARGIVYESSPIEDVLKAVRVVQAGQVWAPRHVVAATWMRFKAESAARHISDAALAQLLSAREREVLRFAAAGLGNKEVAERLAISQATVKVHLTHIFQKLGVRGRGELAATYYGIPR